MNQKELGELRRRFQPDRSAVSRIYGCYVNTQREVISYLDESLGRMPLEESEKYLGLLKKSLSGALGKNLIDVVFTTEQVMDSDEYRLLSALRESELKSGDIRQEFYRKVIESLDMGDSNYVILLAFDAYDVPQRGGDGESSGSETVFRYVLCCVCPVKACRAELGYFPGENEFHSCSAGQIVSPPELGFLFPAFDDRAANIYNALFYSRKPEELHQEFIHGVFHVEPPMSAAEQREAFQGAVSQALEESYSVEVARSIHEQLTDRMAQHKESGATEPLTVTVENIAAILGDCGVSQERIGAFKANCEEQFGAGSVLSPANLIDAKRFEVKTAEASVSVSPDCSYLMETRIIDGKKYILVPAGEDVEVNGQPVRFASDP